MKTTKKVQSKAATVSSKPKRTTKKAGAPLSHGVGRRKSSVARVWLRRGKGSITVNGKASNEYFDTDFNKAQIVIPFAISSKAANYDAHVNVCGGGVNSQAGAIKLGIARALFKVDATMKADLRKQRLLTVDSRLKERKKPGQPGARRKFQFVKR